MLSGCGVRLLIALIIAGISLFSYWRMRSPNPITGQMQHVNLTVDEEIALGLNAAADPNNPSTYNSGMLASMVAQMIGLKYSRDDELEADRWGVKLMSQAGYDPRAMVEVMKVLEQASAGGGTGHQPEFMSTHPDPGRRIERIEDEIKKLYP